MYNYNLKEILTYNYFSSNKKPWHLIRQNGKQKRYSRDELDALGKKYGDAAKAMILSSSQSIAIP